MKTTAIFEVLSQLRLDSDIHQVGAVIESEISKLQQCLETGVVRLIEKAETTEEGKAILSQLKADQAAEAPAEAVAEPENTFGPKPDETAEQTTTEQVEAQATTVEILSSYKVLKEFEITNQESKNFGIHKEGEVLDANPEAAQGLVDNGTLELLGGSKPDDTVVLPEAGDNL